MEKCRRNGGQGSAQLYHMLVDLNKTCCLFITTAPLFCNFCTATKFYICPSRQSVDTVCIFMHVSLKCRVLSELYVPVLLQNRSSTSIWNK